MVVASYRHDELPEKVMNLYQTQDTAASVRRAYEEYTHVVVNRTYHIIKPVFFRTGLLSDLPIFIYQPWKDGWERQLEKWKAEGGIMLDTSGDGKIGPRDVTVIVEAPLNMSRLNKISEETAEYVVVNRPSSWKTHEMAMHLSAPDSTALRAFRKAVKSIPAGPHAELIAQASRYPKSNLVCSDMDLASELNLPMIDVMKMRQSMNCQEIWCVTPRLPPTDPALVSTWEKIMSLPGKEKIFTRLEGSIKMWRRAVKEMARLGNIGLRRYYVYAKFEPAYKRLEEVHKTAMSELKQIRQLLAAAPEHLPSQPPSV